MEDFVAVWQKTTSVFSFSQMICTIVDTAMEGPNANHVCRFKIEFCFANLWIPNPRKFCTICPQVVIAIFCALSCCWEVINLKSKALIFLLFRAIEKCFLFSKKSTSNALYPLCPSKQRIEKVSEHVRRDKIESLRHTSKTSNMACAFQYLCQLFNGRFFPPILDCYRLTPDFLT